MAIQWGAWEYSGGNGMRLGIDVSVSSVGSGSSSVTFTYKVYTQNQYQYSDPQTLTFGGSYSGAGSLGYTNNVGSSSADGGGVILRATKTFTYNYGSSYGTSPGSTSFSAAVSGAYNGVTPSNTVTTKIPARPYSVPASPSSVAVTPAGATADITWTRNVTAQRPYTSQTLAVRSLTGSVWTPFTYTTISATATSYHSTGLARGKLYEYAVRGNNTAGSSPYAGYVRAMNAPLAPTSVEASLTGSTIEVEWTVPAYPETSSVVVNIQRSVAGGAFANVATGLARSLRSWIDPSPGAGTNQYRVNYSAVPPYGPVGGAASEWTNSNTVSTLVPPLAPTQLSPNGTPVDLANEGVTLKWKHNHGGDGAKQSMYSIRYSTNGGTSWTDLAVDVASATSQRVVAPGVLPNGATYLWQVRTKGVGTAGYGPYSASATIPAASRPTATIEPGFPSATTVLLPLEVQWAYNQNESSPQTGWQLQVLDSNDTTVYQDDEASAATSTTVNAALVDGETYTIRVAVRSGVGLWSEFDEAVTVLDLLPPLMPDLVPEYDVCSGTVALHLTVPAVTSGTRTNYAVNPEPSGAPGNFLSEESSTFETGIGNWIGTSGADVDQDATHADTGTQSMLITWPDAAANASSATYVHDTPNPLTIGRRYRVRARVWVPVGVPAVRIAPVQEFFPYYSPESSGNGAFVTIEAELVATQQNLDIVIRANAATTAGQQTWVDNITVTEVTGWYSTAPDPQLQLLDRPYSPGRQAAGVVGDGTSSTNLVAPVSGAWSSADVITPSVELYSDAEFEVVIRSRIDGATVGATPAAIPVPAGVATRVEQTITLSAAVTSSLDIDMILRAPGGGALPDGQLVLGGDLLVEEGADAGEYFDGDTPDSSGLTYSWTSVPGMSSSTEYAPDSVPLESVMIERRIEGVEGWVTLVEGLTVPNDFIDTLPTVNGTNVYRVTGASATPSYAVSDEIVVEGLGGERGGCSLWVFLSYGPGFGNILRVQNDPDIQEQIGRAREVRSFLGRKKPVAMIGSNTARVIQFSGTLHYDDWVRRDSDCLYDSPPGDWDDASLESEVVCFRDYTGRRVFGTLSAVQITEGLYKGFAKVSFSVTESDYVETPGVIVATPDPVLDADQWFETNLRWIDFAGEET